MRAIRASLSGVGGVLKWMTCYYYCYCYYCYYPEEKKFECLLLKQKRKNVLNKFAQ